MSFNHDPKDATSALLDDAKPFSGDALFRAYFETAPEMLCVVDAEGTVLEVNAFCRQDLGWPGGAAVGAAFPDLVAPDDRPLLHGVIGNALRCGADTVAAPRPRLITLRVTASDGGLRRLDIRVTRLPGHDGVVLRLTGTHDLSRRASHADEVEAVTKVGTWEVELETGVVQWSEMTYAIHELSPADFTPTLETALAFYPADAREILIPAVERLIASGEPFSLELPLVTATGRRIMVRSTSSAEFRDGAVSRVYGTFKDITEEQRQLEEISRFSALAERTSNAVIVCDPMGKITWVNRGFERLTGYREAEVLGRTPGSMLQCSKSDPAMIRRFRSATRRGVQVRGEIVNRRKDGSLYWVDIDIEPMFDGNGALKGYISIETDITERKEAEARLLEAERAARTARQTLEAAVEVLDDGFALYDPADRLVICNERYRELYAASASAIQPGQTFEEILRAGLKNGQYLEAIGREEAWLEDRLHAHRFPGGPQEQLLPDGRWIRVVERATPDGGRVGLRSDITELKRQERRLADIIGGTNVGTWEWNCQTGAKIVNARWAEIVGLSLEEASHDTEGLFHRLLHPDDAGNVHRALQRHLCGDENFYEAEFRLRHKDGHWVWVLDRGRISSRLPDGSPEWISGTHQDITARKEAEAAFAIALEEARQASVAKSLFLANMSHEIRTPMNGVLGMAEVLYHNVEDPDLKRMVGDIRESGEVLLNIINDILDFSKIEAGHLELESITFLPEEIGRRLNSLHALKANEKRLSFSVTTTGGDRIPRIGDPHRILQVLHNLVSNAIKFTSDGEVCVRIGCEPGRPMTLEVRDTGIGMSREQLDTLFDEFLQADSSTTRRFGGTGLGMSIVKRLVEAMDGTIHVESEPGTGTVVRVTLPLPVGQDASPIGDTPVTPAPADIHEPASGHERPFLTGFRILAADDNPINRTVIRSLLISLGADVTAVSSGPEALDAATRETFDLLMLDISMPEMDGIEALERIRAEEHRQSRPPMPAIAVTANALKHQVEHYLGAGFDAHVAKPIRPGALRSTLSETLGIDANSAARPPSAHRNLPRSGPA